MTSRKVRRRTCPLATNREEIIADFQKYIRKSGGASSDWLIGTAKDMHSPFFRNHIVADLGDGLIYREAFTTNAAQAIRDHFVNDCGLQADGAERRGRPRCSGDLRSPDGGGDTAATEEPNRGSALRDAGGKIVFIYKRGDVKSPLPTAASVHCLPHTDHPVFSKRVA